MEVIKNSDGLWTISYIPNEVGETYIDVFLGNEIVHGSPFKVNIFDVNQLHISNILDGIVGHPIKFDIDASKAGVGQLEIVIQDGQIPCHAISHGSFQFDATFLPHEPGRYTIDIKFNGILVPGNLQLKRRENVYMFRFFLGSPFSCYISDLSRITVSDSLTSAHIGHPLSFDIHHLDLYDYHNQTGLLDVVITGRKSFIFEVFEFMFFFILSSIGSFNSF